MHAFSYGRLTFCSCDLDLELMTLINEFNLDILKIYTHTKNARSRLSKVRIKQDRHTDRQFILSNRNNEMRSTTTVTAIVMLQNGINAATPCMKTTAMLP